MAKKKIAINGFGRIGRLTFRNLLESDKVEVVAINDLTDNHTLAHLLKYDSAQGQFKGTVSSTDDKIIVNGVEIAGLSEKDPTKLPWAEMGVDLVLECTGRFVDKESAGQHLKAGAKDVLISAPAKGDVQTIVLGVNDDQLDRRANVFSNASCTTNCLAPVAKVVEDNWGLVVGSASTIHAYTADQRLQDSPHKDLRRARAAAVNIVPTETGAAKAVALVLPSVKGKLHAIALRVPVITGSMVELNLILQNPPASVEELNATFKAAADGPMKGVLQYSTDPLVSSDIIGNKHSSIFDSQLSQVHGNFVKLVSWYDNEAGYSQRLADFALMILRA